MVGADPQISRYNYFIGRDPTKWRRMVKNYSRVLYHAVYPGVDLVYYGNHRELEYDFVLAPGAKVEQIAWEILGISRVAPATAIDSQGNLLVPVGSAMLRLHKPIVYEISDKTRGRDRRRHFLDGSYRYNENGLLGFAVAGHDSSKTLVIDPVLEYSTYLGGSASDTGSGVAVDSSGNIYITGETLSTDFPTQNATQSSCASCTASTPNADVFVTKFDAAASSLIYSTYLGGKDDDAGFGIAVDAAGNAYVTGSTNSSNFPTTSGASQTNCTSCLLATPLPDAFVAKLDNTGALSYSTFLGGDKGDEGLAIAADSSGTAYVTGATSSGDFPTLNPLPKPNDHLQGTQNAFVSKFNAQGVLQSSTYLGGSDQDAGYGIAVDSSGIYVAGQTSSNNFPTLNPLQGTFKGIADSFVSKLNLLGTALIYSTYLGGTAKDGASGLAVDSSGNVYITGSTASADFPATPGAFQTSLGGASDAFVAKLNGSGSQLVYSTYLGGSSQDAGAGIAVDGSGNANIIGLTTSSDFPTANPVQERNNGNTDAFVARLVPSGCAPTLSTYLGGHSTDVGTAIAADSSGNAFVTGRTSANDFPVQNAFQKLTAGSFDAFLARLNNFTAAALCVNPNNLTFAGQAMTTTSTAQKVTVTNGGNADLQITDITASGSFGQTSTCTNSSVAAGATCEIDVTFDPTIAGRNVGAIAISDNAGGSPQSIALLGIGTDFMATVSPRSAAVTAGQQATFTLTVSPLSGFNSTVTLTCADAPPDTTCSFSTNSVTLNGSSPATPTVTVSTAPRHNLIPPRGPRFPETRLYVRMVLILLVALAILFAWAQMLRPQENLKAVNYARLAGFAALLLIAMFGTSCGFKTDTPTGTPAGNYALALTATAGSLQHSVRVTLTVN